jgi:hypothetical protein
VLERMDVWAEEVAAPGPGVGAVGSGPPGTAPPGEAPAPGRQDAERQSVRP